MWQIAYGLSIIFPIFLHKLASIQKYPKFKSFLAAGDYLSLIAGLYFCVSIVEYIDPLKFEINSILRIRLLIVYSVFSCFQIFYFQFAGLYKIQNILKRSAHIFLLTKSSFFSVLAFIIVIFFIRIGITSRIFYLILYLISFLLLLSVRSLLILLIKHSSILCDKVIIVGAGKAGQSLSTVFLNEIKVNEPIGFLDDSLPVGTLINGIPVLGEIYSAHMIAKSNNINFFVMAIDNLTKRRFFQVLQYFNQNNITLYITSKYLRVLYENIQLDNFNSFRVIRMGQPNQSVLLKLSKRLFDILVSLVSIIVLSPLFIIITIIIKISTKNSVIFKQTRIGKEGKPFVFYKFRSMKANGDNDNNRDEKVINFIKGKIENSINNTKIVNHSKITKFGKFIRKTSLDELPQLINVLKGNMSIVGPRPCLPLEWNVYENWQKERLRFMPGCTGIWQVCGRGKVNFQETVLMDLYYNCNVSLWLDLKIIINTIPVILFGKGGG